MNILINYLFACLFMQFLSMIYLITNMLIIELYLIIIYFSNLIIYSNYGNIIDVLHINLDVLDILVLFH